MNMLCVVPIYVECYHHQTGQQMDCNKLFHGYTVVCRYDNYRKLLLLINYDYRPVDIHRCQ